MTPSWREGSSLSAGSGSGLPSPARWSEIQDPDFDEETSSLDYERERLSRTTCGRSSRAAPPYRCHRLQPYDGRTAFSPSSAAEIVEDGATTN